VVPPIVASMIGAVPEGLPALLGKAAATSLNSVWSAGTALGGLARLAAVAWSPTRSR